MDAAREYVATLQAARAEEDERRESRRVMRAAYLTSVRQQRTQRSRQALQRSVWRHVDTTTSAVELDLFDSIRSTARWWETLCQHAIEQQLRCESAAQRHRSLHEDYLHSMMDREKQELANVAESDERRWQTLQAEYLREETTTRQEAVSEAVQLALSTVNKRVVFFEEAGLAPTRHPLLARLLMLPTAAAAAGAAVKLHPHAIVTPTISPLSSPASSPLPATATTPTTTTTSSTREAAAAHPVSEVDVSVFVKEALETVLGEWALVQSSTLFAQLMWLLYRVSVQEGNGHPRGRALAGVVGWATPVFVVDGPKYSGKTFLSDHLEKHFLLRKCSGRDLIERALQAYHSQDAAVAEGPASGEDGSPAPQPPVVPSPIWASLGKCIDEVLRDGGAVDTKVIAKLLHLQLTEIAQDAKAEEDSGGTAAAGLLFDGVLSAVEEYKALQHVLQPPAPSPFVQLLLMWCGTPPLPPQRGGSGDNTSRGSCPSSSSSPSVLPVGEEGVTSANEVAVTDADVPATAVEEASLRAAVVNGEVPFTVDDVPEAFKVSKVHFEEPPKKEPKTKAGKRGADAASLPPLQLPEVEDVGALIAREKQFIATALAKLRRSGGLVTAILHIECSAQEIFHRYAGLRVDRETGEAYHMVYHPPPEDRVPYLTGVDRTKASTAQLHRVILHQERQWQQLVRWLQAQPCALAHVYTISSDSDLDAMRKEAEGVVMRAQESYALNQRMQEAIAAAEARVRALADTRVQQWATREAARRQLATEYTEKGMQLPPELSVPASTPLDVPKSLAEVILNATTAFAATYLGSYQWAWRSAGDLAQLLVGYRASTKTQMEHYWLRPDPKQELLDGFLRRFNAVPAACRSHVAAKEELHAYVEELNEALYGCVGAKQNDCLALMERLTRRDVFVDGWESSLGNVGMVLVSAEVERFVVAANSVLLYFSSLLEQPCMFEELEVDLSLLRPTTESVTGADTQSVSSQRPARSRAGNVKKSGHGRASEEVTEKALEDVFAETVQRVTTTLTAFAEKFKGNPEGATRTQKKSLPVTLQSVKMAAVTAHVVPVLEAEVTRTVQRLERLRDFIGGVAQEGKAYVQSAKDEILQEATKVFVAQAAAVNTALYTLRCCIEEETTAPAMHLGCGTFAVLSDGTPGSVKPSARRESSFLTDVPLTAQPAPPTAVLIHPTLTAARLLSLIETFRRVAPRYQLSWEEFERSITPEDYAAAAMPSSTAAAIAEINAPPTLKTPREVFHTFDRADTGVLDWRELVVHLLLWCCPPPALARPQQPPPAASLYIPEMTLEQLFQTRDDIGLEPLKEDVFRDLPFFFDEALGDERLEAFTGVLWLTFSDVKTSLLDPYALLWFLCADPQPVRGAQKAFYVFSPATDPGRLTLPEMDRLLHVKANNARAVAAPDMCSKPNLRLLFGDAETLTFDDVSSCALGRKLLNGIDVFQRKRFIVEPLIE